MNYCASTCSSVLSSVAGEKCIPAQLLISLPTIQRVKREGHEQTLGEVVKQLGIYMWSCTGRISCCKIINKLWWSTGGSLRPHGVFFPVLRPNMD